MSFALSLTLSHPSKAHDKWANNVAVPPWVKAACCGPNDVHLIDLKDIERGDGGYMVAGNHWFPDDHVFDSMDGEVWAFYDSIGNYCLFIPRTS